MSKNSFSWLAVLLLAASVGFVLPSRGQNRGQDQVQLPEGNGQATVQAACGVCHSMNQVTNSGHDREEWTTVLHMMVNVGAPVPDNQFDTVVDYLAKNFPPKPQPPAQIIPGNVDVTIKEWVVPTPGSRPHDPMFAPDGTVWYSGQMANVLGHFDPKTEQFKEY
jgi:virginiamycin B lyase